MGNKASKKKMKEMEDKQFLQEQLYKIEMDKLPNENDPPNNKTEYKILITGYLTSHINKSDKYVISQDIVGVIAGFYPYQFVIERKAIKICRIKNLKTGLKYLLKQYDDIDIVRNTTNNKTEYVARFLYLKHPYIDSGEIGEFLCNYEDRIFNVEEHSKLLSEYMKYINLNNVSVLNAFRKFLNSGFGLPREAPTIDRLMNAFAKYYVKSNEEYGGHTWTQENVVLLSYAILMLNTDLHNSKVKNPMVKSAFRNLANPNVNHIPITVIDEIYDSIESQPLFASKK